MDELTDLEICKRIAEIEGLEISCEWDCGNNGILIGKGGGDLEEYNPLTDDALCFRLMIKYSVDIQHGKSMGLAKVYDDPEDNPLSEICFYQEDAQYSKAICLAIIKSKE